MLDKVLIIAGLVKVLADKAPGVIKTVQDALPTAEAIIKIVKSEHITQEEVNALMAEIEADEAKIQAPIAG